MSYSRWCKIADWRALNDLDHDWESTIFPRCQNMETAGDFSFFLLFAPCRVPPRSSRRRLFHERSYVGYNSHTRRDFLRTNWWAECPIAWIIDGNIRWKATTIGNAMVYPMRSLRFTLLVQLSRCHVHVDVVDCCMLVLVFRCGWNIPELNIISTGSIIWKPAIGSCKRLPGFPKTAIIIFF